MLAVANYRDVFGTPHVTKYCAAIKLTGGDPYQIGTPLSVTTDPCDSHNCFDQECAHD